MPIWNLLNRSLSVAVVRGRKRTSATTSVTDMELRPGGCALDDVHSTHANEKKNVAN